MDGPLSTTPLVSLTEPKRLLGRVVIDDFQLGVGAGHVQGRPVGFPQELDPRHQDLPIRAVLTKSKLKKTNRHAEKDLHLGVFSSRKSTIPFFEDNKNIACLLP